MGDSFVDFLISAALPTTFFFSFLFISIFYFVRKDMHRAFVLNRIDNAEKKSLIDRACAILARYRSYVKRVGFADAWLPLFIVFSIFVILWMYLIFFVVVASDSMQPMFGRGDIVLVQSFDMSLNVGDIVMYKTEYTTLPVIHRIVAIRNDNIQTMGDAAGNPDFWSVKKTDVLAKAVILSGRPVVIHDLGIYFIMDYTDVGMVAKYGDTFALLSIFVKSARIFAPLLFIIAIISYLVLTEREARRTYRY